MDALELKVPPPAVALIIAAIMWGVSLIVAPFDVVFGVRATAALGVALLGVALSMAAVFSFRRAHTTIDPVAPGAASALVTSGVYHVTRNPMYLGVLLILIGWGIFLASLLAVVCAFAFVPYMNRFQIRPEERALSAVFGRQFSDYTSHVRRWL